WASSWISTRFSFSTLIFSRQESFSPSGVSQTGRSSFFCAPAMASRCGFGRREAETHIVGDPDALGIEEPPAERILDLALHRVTLALRHGGEEALAEGVEPIAERARQRRRPRNERDARDREAAPLEARAILLRRREIPGHRRLAVET